MYGGSAYATTPYAGGGAGEAAPVVVTIPAEARGRVRLGRGLVSLDVAVAPLPAGVVRAVRVDKALAYPTPVLVDGRPA